MRAKHILSNELIALTRISTGNKMSQRCQGGFIRTIAKESGLLVETQEDWIFLPDRLILQAGYAIPSLQPQKKSPQVFLSNSLQSQISPKGSKPQKKRKR